MGRNELHDAALEGDIGKTRAELAAGADPDRQDRNGMAPLHFAAQHNAAEVAAVLVEAGASVDLPDSHGNTPLFKAVFGSRGSGETIAVLREAGADPLRANGAGQTPAGLARVIKNYDVARFFTDVAARKKATREEVGDIFTMPLGDGRLGYGQIVHRWGDGQYYVAVFDGTHPPHALPSTDAVLRRRVVLLALTLDALFVHEQWRIVGRGEVPVGAFEWPAYKEAVMPEGRYEVVDYTGEQRRRATDDEVAHLPNRTSVAPIRVEHAFRALNGFGVWEPKFDDLLARTEGTAATLPTMTGTRERPVTAAELAAELSSDPGFQAAQREREASRLERVEANMRAAQPLLADLAELGFEVSSPADLYNKSMDYRRALPLLLHWLPRLDNNDVKETVVRALTVRWARPDAARPLFIELASADTPNLRWAIASALEVVCGPEHHPALVSAAENARDDSERRMLAHALRRAGATS